MRPFKIPGTEITGNLNRQRFGVSESVAAVGTGVWRVRKRFEHKHFFF